MENQNKDGVSIMTMSDVTDYFLDRGFSIDKLAEKTGVPRSDLDDLFANPLQDLTDATRLERRLKKLYIRERIKDMLRWSPFMGPARIRENLGISQEHYQNAYQTLLDLGEVCFEHEMPDWATATNGKTVRKHTVVK